MRTPPRHRAPAALTTLTLATLMAALLLLGSWPAAPARAGETAATPAAPEAAPQAAQQAAPKAAADAPAPGQDKAPPALVEPPLSGGLDGGDMTWALMKTVGGLAAVLGLMGILYWAMRRFAPGQALAGRGGHLKVVGRLGLGPRKQLAVVKVADRLLVLGISQDRLELLDKITEPEAMARLTGEEGDFAASLERAGQREQE